MTVTLNELEYAGAMKFRFVEIDEDDYGPDGIDFVPNTVNLNRFQIVLVNVNDSTDATSAQYFEDDEAIRAYDEGVELADGEDVSLSVVAIGR